MDVGTNWAYPLYRTEHQAFRVDQLQCPDIDIMYQVQAGQLDPRGWELQLDQLS